jgi:HSP20 family protein
MTTLISRDNPFQELFDFRREFDQVFNRFMSWPSTREEHHMTRGFAPAIQSFIDKDGRKFHCQVMLPRVDAKDVNIQVQGNTLTITGERSESHEADEADYLQKEFTYGSFQRSLMLPEGVEKDRLSAEYRNGLLEITAPIAAASLPRKVEIKALAPAAKHASA